MYYYEVFIADSKYHSSAPLTYSHGSPLEIMSVITVPLRARVVTAFVIKEVSKPSFTTKPVKSVQSKTPMPFHCYELALWLEQYYTSTLSEALKQFAPSKPVIRKVQEDSLDAITTNETTQLELESALTSDQLKVIKHIKESSNTTTLLHGVTGSGKTRVYLELAKDTLDSGRSVMMLTPEIALTTQLVAAFKKRFGQPVYVLHSKQTQAERKKIWFEVLESKNPVVIIGPRSALFSPVHNLGLIILDEAHETAYKQEQSPRYHSARVASRLGLLCEAKVVLGTATPAVTDYYLAKERNSIVTMSEKAIKGDHDIDHEIIDLRDKNNLSADRHLSDRLIAAAKETLLDKKQVLIYLNRRGSARLVLCNNCGWELLCPNCDIPLVYHGDSHSVRCHICAFSKSPPSACPQCNNPDIIYKSIGTKALTETVKKLFPGYNVQRFDSDNVKGEHLNEVYDQVKSGRVQILVGTQLLAKGLDLPKLGLVGIINAESSLGLPDFSSEERTFQLLYQVAGRVGRGHGKGKVILQTYEPNSAVVKAAIEHDWDSFYKYILNERKNFKFPPFSYLMQLTCRRATIKGVQQASERLANELADLHQHAEIIGPSPSFYARRGKYFYYQLTIKSKDRDTLLKLAKHVPSDWTINLDPVDLL